jgi:hypothetical protein
MKKSINLKAVKALLVLASLGVNFSVFSQNKEIPLWDKVPDEIISKEYSEKIVTDKNGIAEDVRKVTKPTLTAYFADPQKSNGTAVIICPGGGYGMLAINKEGFKVAQWLNGLGINAFVLKYRLPSDLIMKNKTVGPLQDAQQAVRLVRRNAVKWKLNPNKIGIMGFSAGGHLASTLSTHYNAYLNDVMEQLEGQIASAKVAMARLSSPQLYYVLSGNDFTLDINNPREPKIVCMGNNPQKIQIYGAVLSLYVNRLLKLVNQKDKQKSSLIFDEFPTIYLNNMDSLIATARSNKVATCLGIQDFSQLRKDYGREQADVIMNITGNIISGQVTGDTARQLSERFGKIMQDRESISINSSDVSVSRSRQLESAVPPSKISGLSSGEFVGVVADDPLCKIALKAFHCEIINDHQLLGRQTENYKEIPIVRRLSTDAVQQNYLQIKQEIQDIIFSEMDRLMSHPELSELIIKK